MQGNVKNTVKDSIFCNLFKIKKYLLQLYQALHPEDSGMTEDGLENITINHVFTNGIYNDLCFRAGGKLILMLEAQSTWSVNVIIRMFIYLAQTYHEYFRENGTDLYGSRRAVIPEPELYVVYTGNRKKRQKYISLSKEFFGGKRTNIETINICKDKNLLKEYLESKEKEVVDIMMALFDQEEVFNTYVKSEVREARKEAEKEGRKEGSKETAKKIALKFLEMGKCSIDEIRDLIPELDEEDIIEIEKGFIQQM